jgi:hypothetical protein
VNRWDLLHRAISTCAFPRWIIRLTGAGHFPGCLGHRAGRMLAHGGPTGCLRNSCRAWPPAPLRRAAQIAKIQINTTPEQEAGVGAAGNPAGIDVEIAQLHQGICSLLLVAHRTEDEEMKAACTFIAKHMPDDYTVYNHWRATTPGSAT